MMQANQGPIYLTAEGHRRLERRLEAYEAELRAADTGSGKDEAEDTVGQALIGHTPGDWVAIDTAEGKRILTILSVTPYRQPAL